MIEAIATWDSGYANAVFNLDGKLVLKIYGPDSIDAPSSMKQFLVEKAVLENVVGSNPEIPSPDIVSAGISSEQRPYIIMTSVSGVPMTEEVWQEMSHDNRLEIATHLGEIIGAFHRSDATSISSIEAEHGGWKAFREQRAKEFRNGISEIVNLPKRVRQELLDFIDSEAQQYINAFPVLVHADLTGEHILLVEKDSKWEISGLIDFADTMIAPCEFEWNDLWFSAFFQDIEAMRSFLEAYSKDLKMDANFGRRCLALQLHTWYSAHSLQKHLEWSASPPINSIQELQDLLWPPSLWRAE